MGGQAKDSKRDFVTVASHLDEVMQLCADHVRWGRWPAYRLIVDDDFVAGPTIAVEDALAKRVGLQRAGWVKVLGAAGLGYVSA